MKKILLIDEELWYFDALLDLIRYTTTHVVTVAANCSDAVILFKKNKYDCIILDLALPAGNYYTVKGIIDEREDKLFGLQLLRFFRKEDDGIRIIGYSVADTKEIQQSFRQLNADYVPKLSENSFNKLRELITLL